MCGGRGNLYNQYDFGNCWAEPSCYRKSDPLDACGGKRKSFVVGVVIAVAGIGLAVASTILAGSV